MSLEENTFHDRTRLMNGLCAAMGEWMTEALSKRRKISIALAGGTSPGPLYQDMSHLVLDWSKVTVTLTDERWVSPEDPSSNEYLIRNRLLHRRAEEATFIPFKTNHATPQAGAATTERRLKPALPIDICLLGMGTDGHIASLIPGATGYEAAVDPAGDRMVAGLHADNAAGSPDRMTLTMPALLKARRIILLIMGAEKQRVFDEARNQEGDSPVRYLLTGNRTPIHTFWAP